MHGVGAIVMLAVGNLLGATSPFSVSVFTVTEPARAMHAESLGVAGTRSDSLIARLLTPQQVQFDAARFDTLTARLLGEIFDSAAARGLPTAPLINRALEGSARRVNGRAIVSNVRAYVEFMEDARQALGPNSSVAEIESGASALRNGVDERTLAMVRATRPNSSVEMPIMVLTDIIARGVPPARAREAVTTLAKMPKNSDDALMGLFHIVAKNSLRGPGMAVDALNRYVKGTVSGSVPSSTPVTTDRKPIRPPNP